MKILENFSITAIITVMKRIHLCLLEKKTKKQLLMSELYASKDQSGSDK